MPTFRPTLAAALIVLSSVVAASLAALIVGQLSVASLSFAPVAAAAIVALLFAWRAPEGLVAFGIFALLAETIEHWLGVDLLLFDEVAIGLMTAAVLVVHGLPKDRLRLGISEVALLVLVAAAVMSSILGGVPTLTWLAALSLLVKAILLFYLISFLRLSIRDVERMGAIIVGFALAIGVLGLVELVNPAAFQDALNLPPFEGVRGDVSVVRAIFLHPAQFGWITAFGSLLLYARFIVRRTWWALPLAVALNVGTLVSGRRTPVLGILAGLATAMLWQFRRLGSGRGLLRTWLPVGAAIALLAALSVPALGGFYRTTLAQYLPPASQIEEIFAEEPDALALSTLQPRTALYLASIAIARDHLPFGVGLGRFGSHLSREDYSPVYEEYGLHRIYLLSPKNPVAVTDAYWPMVLGETGIIGLGAALTFFGSLFVTLWRNAGAATSPEGRAIAVGIMLVFVEGLVRSLTSSVFVAPPIAYFVLGAAGLSIAMRRTSEETAEAELNV